MDNSILTILLKLLENKEVLNTISQIFLKQNSDFSSNTKKVIKNEINNSNNMPLYPEPLYYQTDKNENNNTNLKTAKSGNNFDVSSLLSSLSSLNLSDLISKINPLLNIANSLKINEKNKKNTTDYGANDIDLENLIRSD